MEGESFRKFPLRTQNKDPHLPPDEFCLVELPEMMERFEICIVRYSSYSPHVTIEHRNASGVTEEPSVYFCVILMHLKAEHG